MFIEIVQYSFQSISEIMEVLLTNKDLVLPVYSNNNNIGCIDNDLNNENPDNLPVYTKTLDDVMEMV